MKFLKNNWHKGALILILAVTGLLSFYSIGNEGYANQYYSAAVKSMLQSWHNFFFASFDPGGYVTVDKPALGLWLQAASAFIFGFHGWSLILPEALSAIVSTILIYHLVQKYFGRTSGIVSASIFGLTPILIAVSRTNNLDSSLVMVLLFAAWALLVAVEKGSLKLLLLSMALVGLGFNIKMLEAFMVIPAFLLVYLFTTPIKLKKRFIHLTGAAAILLVVSLSWATVVDLIPSENRPYVGSSKTNSVIELALGYNGIQRLTGRSAGNGGGGDTNDGRNAPPINNGGGNNNGTATASNDGTVPAPDNNPAQNGNNNNGRFQAPPGSGEGDGSRDRTGDGGNSFNGMNHGGGFNGAGGPRGGFGGNMRGGPGSESENGQKGILRIFNQQLAGQISWLLPMALFGIVVLCIKSYRNRKDKITLRFLLLWAGWLLPMLVFFSIAGFYHRYYLAMLAPAIAALAGAGLVEMCRSYMEIGWKWFLLPTALLATAFVQALIISRYNQWSMLLYIVCGVCIAAVIALVIIRLFKMEHLGKTIKTAMAVGFIILLAAPGIWAYTPIIYGSQTTLPVAGPELDRNGDSGNGGQQGFTQGFRNGDTNSELIKFLLENRKGEKFMVAVADANSAAPIILETGQPVMALGGFSGTDNIMTVERLERMVKNGEIRYFEIAGRGMGGQSEITDWVMKNGVPVTLDNPGGQFNGQLYDLASGKSS